jgi:cell envelope opacity-associated protein A
MIAENTDINNILKSAINNLIRENKQLLESNEQLKKEDSKLRNYIINIVAHELETPQQFSQQFPDIPMMREDIIRLTQLTHNAALKLHHQVEDMKGNIKKN